MPINPGGLAIRASVSGAMLAVILMPQLAWAALGEPEASITNEAQQLKAAIKSTERANYRVHEIQLPSGTTLREYAAAGGSVFGIAWSGPAMPDLRQALGRYFDGYVTAAKAKHGVRHHFEVRQDAFVMQSGGHMRAFAGRAYVPQGLPAGLSPDEIR